MHIIETHPGNRPDVYTYMYVDERGDGGFHSPVSRLSGCIYRQRRDEERNFPSSLTGHFDNYMVKRNAKTRDSSK